MYMIIYIYIHCTPDMPFNAFQTHWNPLRYDVLSGHMRDMEQICRMYEISVGGRSFGQVDIG